MSGRPQLVLRADAGPEVGIGHLMRCVALAQAWQEQGGSTALASAGLPPALKERLDREGIERIPVSGPPGSRKDAEALARQAADRGACVALDGYHLGPEYQRLVAAAARRILLVADHGRPEAGPVDLLLDQNLGAGSEGDPDPPASRRDLLGPRFALLRREFRAAAREPAKRRFPPRRLLVSLGGGAPGELCLPLLDAVARGGLGLTEITVVVGPAHRGDTGRGRFAEGGGPELALARDPESMVPLIQRADVAVSAAGSTCWELACLGLPAVVLPIAHNQEPVARALDEQGVALSAGPAERAGGTDVARLLARLTSDRELYEALRERGMLLVDGEGAPRVARALATATEESRRRGLTLRPATMADARLLWAWANDPEVRAASFHSDPIRWHEHEAWLAARLNDPGTRIYVALDGTGEPVGQVRFEGCDGEAELGVSVARECRGGGLGTELIALGTRRLFADSPATRIDAFVKPTNEASKKAFLKAGFVPGGARSTKGSPSVVFHLERPGER